MNEIPTTEHQRINLAYSKEKNTETKPIKIEKETDTFEKEKKKMTPSGILIASGSAMAACPKTFNFGKKKVMNLLDKTDDFIKTFLNDLSNTEAIKTVKESETADDIANTVTKTYKGIPPKAKIIAGYIGGLSAAIATFCLIFKDSDKNGHLDLIEGIKEITNT